MRVTSLELEVRQVQGSGEEDATMMPSPGTVLERTVSLGDIIDPDSLQRVCMTFARTHATGIAVLDTKGEVLVDVPAEHALCRRIAADPGGARLGCSFDQLVEAGREARDDEIKSFQCLCGLHYEVLAIRHQGEILGSLVLGPYRATTTTTVPPELMAILARSNDDATRLALEMDLNRIDARDPAEAKRTIRAINDVLAVIVQTGYARHLTSQIHIAAIQDAYNELSEKNRRLADSVEKLKDLDKLKSSFLATVSHELRTPLTSVIGYSEMLIEGLAGELSKEQREYVGTILEKGDHLLRIINEILDVSRIESGSVKLSPERFDMGDLVRQVADAMMPQARQKDISLTYATEELPAVIADRVKMRQVLINLVSNAIKFTPTGGTVALTAQVGELDFSGDLRPCVDLVVRDNGIGVPAEAREDVFEAFYQVDSSSTREYGGTGLGLSIVKHFVEAHGGRVWVEDPDVDEAGSLFIVQLPLHSSRDSTLEASKRTR